MHLADAKKGEASACSHYGTVSYSLIWLVKGLDVRLFDQSHAEATPNFMYVV